MKKHTFVLLPETNLKGYIFTHADFILVHGSQIAQEILCFIVSKRVKHKEQPAKQIMSYMLIWKIHTNGKHQPTQFQTQSQSATRNVITGQKVMTSVVIGVHSERRIIMLASH